MVAAYCCTALFLAAIGVLACRTSAGQVDQCTRLGGSTAGHADTQPLCRLGGHVFGLTRPSLLSAKLRRSLVSMRTVRAMRMQARPGVRTRRSTRSDSTASVCSAQAWISLPLAAKSYSSDRYVRVVQCPPHMMQPVTVFVCSSVSDEVNSTCKQIYAPQMVLTSGNQFAKFELVWVESGCAPVDPATGSVSAALQQQLSFSQLTNGSNGLYWGGGGAVSSNSSSSNQSSLASGKFTGRESMLKKRTSSEFSRPSSDDTPARSTPTGSTENASFTPTLIGNAAGSDHSNTESQVDVSSLPLSVGSKVSMESLTTDSGDVDTATATTNEGQYSATVSSTLNGESHTRPAFQEMFVNLIAPVASLPLKSSAIVTSSSLSSTDTITTSNISSAKDPTTASTPGTHTAVTHSPVVNSSNIPATDSSHANTPPSTTRPTTASILNDNFTVLPTNSNVSGNIIPLSGTTSQSSPISMSESSLTDEFVSSVPADLDASWNRLSWSKRKQILEIINSEITTPSGVETLKSGSTENNITDQPAVNSTESRGDVDNVNILLSTQSTLSASPSSSESLSGSTSVPVTSTERVDTTSSLSVSTEKDYMEDVKMHLAMLHYHLGSHNSAIVDSSDEYLTTKSVSTAGSLLPNDTSLYKDVTTTGGPSVSAGLSGSWNTGHSDDQAFSTTVTQMTADTVSRAYLAENTGGDVSLGKSTTVISSTSEYVSTEYPPVRSSSSSVVTNTPDSRLESTISIDDSQTSSGSSILARSVKNGPIHEQKSLAISPSDWVLVRRILAAFSLGSAACRNKTTDAESTMANMVATHTLLRSLLEQELVQDTGHLLCESQAAEMVREILNHERRVMVEQHAKLQTILLNNFQENDARLAQRIDNVSQHVSGDFSRSGAVPKTVHRPLTRQLTENNSQPSTGALSCEDIENFNTENALVTDMGCYISTNLDIASNIYQLFIPDEFLDRSTILGISIPLSQYISTKAGVFLNRIILSARLYHFTMECFNPFLNVIESIAQSLDSSPPASRHNDFTTVESRMSNISAMTLLQQLPTALSELTKTLLEVLPGFLYEFVDVSNHQPSSLPVLLTACPVDDNSSSIIKRFTNVINRTYNAWRQIFNELILSALKVDLQTGRNLRVLFIEHNILAATVGMHTNQLNVSSQIFIADLLEQLLSSQIQTNYCVEDAHRLASDLSQLTQLMAGTRPENLNSFSQFRVIERLSVGFVECIAAFTNALNVPATTTSDPFTEDLTGSTHNSSAFTSTTINQLSSSNSAITEESTTSVTTSSVTVVSTGGSSATPTSITTSSTSGSSEPTSSSTEVSSELTSESSTSQGTSSSVVTEVSMSSTSTQTTDTEINTSSVTSSDQSTSTTAAGDASSTSADVPSTTPVPANREAPIIDRGDLATLDGLLGI